MFLLKGQFFCVFAKGTSNCRFLDCNPLNILLNLIIRQLFLFSISDSQLGCALFTLSNLALVVYNVIVNIGLASSNF